MLDGGQRETKRQWNQDRGDAQVNLRNVQSERNQKVRGYQENRRKHDIDQRVHQQEAARRLSRGKLDANAVQFPLQRVDLGRHRLYFKDDRAHEGKVARAMPANERLILDAFDAEGTLHARLDPEPSAGRAKPGLRANELQSELFSLAQQLLVFGAERQRDDDVAMADPANDGARAIVFNAKRTKEFPAAHGTTLKTRMELRVRPSVSEISMRNECSPGGISASGMSMPLRWMKRVRRGTRSISGLLR